MGQPVAVITKPSSTRGIIRFEANRSLTGMGHERFASVQDAAGERPAAMVARRLFATGHVGSVHVYQNIISVDLLKGYDADGLQEVIESLHTYYTPGFVPPPLEMPAEEAPTADTNTTPTADGGPAVDSRVPSALLEKSRLAKERWLANRAGGGD
jgi:hypothetical protein